MTIVNQYLGMGTDGQEKENDMSRYNENRLCSCRVAMLDTIPLIAYSTNPYDVFYNKKIQDYTHDTTPCELQTRGSSATDLYFFSALVELVKQYDDIDSNKQQLLLSHRLSLTIRSHRCAWFPAVTSRDHPSPAQKIYGGRFWRSTGQERMNDMPPRASRGRHYQNNRETILLASSTVAQTVA